MSDNGSQAAGKLTNTLMQKIIGQVYALTKDSKAIQVVDRVQFDDDLRGKAYELEKIVRQTLETHFSAIASATSTSGGATPPPRPTSPVPPPMPPSAPASRPPAPGGAKPAPGGAKDDKKAPAAQQGGGAQRQKFLLRLVAGKFAKLFTGPGVTYLPREIVAGFDSYLVRLLGISKYEELNEHAQELLDKIPSRDDSVIWKTIMENEGFKAFAFDILIKILLKFEEFEWAKKNFMSIVNNVTDRDAKFIFEDRHFKILFVTLFGEVFSALGDEEAMERIDEDFGPNTAYKIKEIHKRLKALK